MLKAVWVFAYGFAAVVVLFDTVDEYDRVAKAKEKVVVAVGERHGQR